MCTMYSCQSETIVLIYPPQQQQLTLDVIGSYLYHSQFLRANLPFANAIYSASTVSPFSSPRHDRSFG